MTVIAMIEPIPEDQIGTETRQGEEISVEAETYEAGRDQLRAEVPAGWRIINLRRA